MAKIPTTATTTTTATTATVEKTYTPDSNGIIEAGVDMTFVRNSDNVRFGHFIQLGANDTMDNYHEEEMTEEEKEAMNGDLDLSNDL